ncbi:DivIVA domain-containing protein [Alloscardovia venturai]|uniref:DivIVA domain-containing protein n=1 Tax=Alloscardovia venturai TaxID=1769421 RepID=A0ABW2Y635_9BIFI
MAEFQEAKTAIPRARKKEWGYSVKQVDEFLKSTRSLYEVDEPNMTQAEIQNVTFDLEKNGYDVAAVDSALRRLEDAIADKLADWTILHEGLEAWSAQNEQLALTLIPRAKRSDRTIFANGRFGKPSYDKKQVDAFVKNIAYFLNQTLALGVFAQDAKGQMQSFDSHGVATVTFTQHRGAHGYDEAQVDAYINRIVEVLSRIEATSRQKNVADIQTARNIQGIQDVRNVQSAPLIEETNSRFVGDASEVVHTSVQLPQSFTPEHKPQRGSTAPVSDVDYSTLMDTGSIQSVQFHLPHLSAEKHVADNVAKTSEQE